MTCFSLTVMGRLIRHGQQKLLLAIMKPDGVLNVCLCGFHTSRFPRDSLIAIKTLHTDFIIREFVELNYIPWTTNLCLQYFRGNKCSTQKNLPNPVCYINQRAWFIHLVTEACVQCVLLTAAPSLAKWERVYNESLFHQPANWTGF